MRVLVLNTWITNVGNGFIDKGARTIIEKAFPDAEIVEASGFPNLAADRKQKGVLSGLYRPLGPIGDLIEYLKPSREPIDMINISELVDFDLCILPGCVLYEHVLDKYEKTLMEIRSRDIPIIILGGGGGDYEQSTKNYVRKKLDELGVRGLITRDSIAYESYSNSVPKSYDGIDCAFFIDEWHSPVQSNKEFIASTFDHNSEPDYNTSFDIIRCDHTPFGNSRPFQGSIKEYWDSFHKSEFFSSDNIFISDSVTDYLFIYRNSRQTHSDRIHACVPTLAYGNKAKFYYETPRAALFDRVLDDDIRENTVQIDQEYLQTEKDGLVEALQNMV